MAITSPAHGKVFPKQTRVRPIAHLFWGDPEKQLNDLIEQMGNNPIPATPVTRAGASIVKGTMKESQSAK